MNHARSHLSCLRTLALACLLAALSLTVHAAKWDRYTDLAWTAGNGKMTAFPAPGSPGDNLSGWARGTMTPAATGPTWTSPTKQLPFNPSPTANFKANFSPANMAKSLMKPGLPLTFAAFSALDYLLQQACTRIAGGVMQLSSSGAWEECNMVTTQQTIWASSGAYNAYKTNPLYATRVDACAPYAVGGHPGFPGDPYKFGCYSGPNVIWSGYDIWYCPAGSPSNAGQSWAKTGSNSSTSYSCGTSLAEVQEGWKPATDAVAESKLTTKLNDWTQADFLYGYEAREGFSTKNVMDTIMNSGNSVEAVLGQPSVQTPIMEAPLQKTFTDPATGTKIETTEQTQNDYSCIVINNGQAVECSQYKKATTTTATSTNPNGTGTVTTTATTVTTKTGEAEKSDCEKTPDVIGCSKYGEGSAGPSIVKDSRAVSITSATFAGGSCPAPVSFSAFGRSYAFEYAPLCDRLASLAPLFLALSALLAAWIFADGFRVT